MALLVWLSVGLLLHAWFGYLALLVVGLGVREAVATARWLARGADRRAPPPAEDAPTVSILIPASGEEEGIRAKLANTLALDWPAARLEVLVGCDGCSDRTAERAREGGDGRVRVVEHARAGRAVTLSRLVAQARGELVVVTEAGALLERGALRALVRPFRDPAVGAVVGRPTRPSPSAAAAPAWTYATLLRYLEGRNGCVVGAAGGAYAVRRMLFTPLPPDTLADDLIAPLRIALRGWRVPYAADAAGDEAAPGGGGFEREARAVAGGWQALLRHPEVLDPGSGFVAFAFLAHELLRWVSPLLLAVAAGGSAALALGEGGLAAWALVLTQAAGWGLAAAGERAPRPLRPAARLARHLARGQLALAAGCWRFVRGTAAAAGPGAPPERGAGRPALVRGA